ncbi:MAG: hypothetical protein ABSC57_04575 [Syntrophales bacterium]
MSILDQIDHRFMFSHEVAPPEDGDLVHELARYTRKEAVEIQQVLCDLRDQGVLTSRDGHISDFSKNVHGTC